MVFAQADPNLDLPELDAPPVDDGSIDADLYGPLVADQMPADDAIPAELTWIWAALGDKDTCDYCDGNDGQSFTTEELNTLGWPGESAFGSTTSGCSGGPLCRCTASPDLTWERSYTRRSQ